MPNRKPRTYLGTTSNFLSRYLLFAATSCCFGSPALAQVWEADFMGDKTTWPSAVDACEFGLAARYEQLEESTQGGNWRYDPDPPGWNLVGQGEEAICNFWMQRFTFFWEPQYNVVQSVFLIPDPVSFYATGDEAKPSCEEEGNPCDVITGRKTQREIDYDDGWLSFVRYYDSGAGDPGVEIGAYWRHTFDTRMDSLPLLDNGGNPSVPQVTLAAPDLRSGDYGSRQDACTSGWNDIKADHRGGLVSAGTASFVNSVCKISLMGSVVDVITIQSNQGYIARVVGPGEWGQPDSPIHTVTTADGGYYTFEETSPGIYEEASKFPVRLEYSAPDFLFYHRDNTIDRFNDGKLISRTFVDGRELSLSYHATTGRLDTVTDDSGNTLQFAYDSDDQIASVTHPAGTISYAYDGNGNLTTVTYEDTKTRQYHYEDTGFPNHLTGITDERNIRFATWAYDADGKAASSKNGDTLNANLTTFTHNGTSTIVSDAAGGTRTYNLGTEGAFNVVTSISGDKCIDCARNRMKTRTYDANGYLNEVTDWEGNITDYDYDSQGLEIQRIEAKGTPLQRTITTQWHPTLRLPTKITEPDRIIDFTYDGNGRLLTRKVTPPPP